MFDLTDVGYVKRIVVGSTDPEKLSSEEAVQAEAALLNRCLSEAPRGRIIGVEKNFAVLNIGEHQVVLQAMTYHVGFARKPYWLDDSGVK
ncbi:MAG: hypothetical protein H7Z12_00945 [Rhodospirillaceae bacterium]|nr:hypothetical protein [Rhodospirillales bacterium]